ncbi:unnamed protein product [Discula destructiva]
MSVAYQHRSFSVDSPYAAVNERDHGHDDDDDNDQEMNKYINTEANVDDMEELAAATYSREAQDDNGGAPSPFKLPESPAAGLDDGPVVPPNVDPSNVPLHRAPSPPRLHSRGSTFLIGSAPLESATRYSPTPRSKPVEKPSRVVTKNDDGMFQCSWPDCKEDSRVFVRKCEWSKHMDKHERPYVCTVKGCEKIQGFTYSGGLLRHEREVHGKHGGPKKSLNCPHANCKRHSGKGFSRLENLQEHLRRVHTLSESSGGTGGGGGSGSGEGTHPHPQLQQLQHHSPISDSASDVASAAFAVMNGLDASPGDTTGSGEVSGATATAAAAAAAARGQKRKRGVDDEGHEEGIKTAMLEENATLRQENDNLRRENQELRTQLQTYQAQLESYQAQVDAVQAAISGLAVAPPPVL